MRARINAYRTLFNDNDNDDTPLMLAIENDDIEVYEDIEHSAESSQEFASHTRIPESDFNQFMDRVDQMNSKISELYVGTVCEARDIFVKYI